MSTDALFEQLKHPNPNLRERAMRELAEAGDADTIPRLMGILGAEDISYRRSAVKTLGVIGVETVPTLVETLLASQNSTVRASCTKALAQVAVNHPDRPFPSVGLQGLNKAVNDTDPVVNIAAAMALGAVGIPALDILLETLTSTDNPAVAVAVVNALGSIDDDRAAEALKTTSNDDSVDPYVSESATSALSRLEMVRQNQRR